MKGYHKTRNSHIAKRSIALALSLIMALSVMAGFSSTIAWADSYVQEHDNMPIVVPFSSDEFVYPGDPAIYFTGGWGGVGGRFMFVNSVWTHAAYRRCFGGTATFEFTDVDAIQVLGTIRGDNPNYTGLGSVSVFNITQGSYVVQDRPVGTFRYDMQIYTRDVIFQETNLDPNNEYRISFTGIVGLPEFGGFMLNPTFPVTTDVIQDVYILTRYYNNTNYQRYREFSGGVAFSEVAGTHSLHTNLSRLPDDQSLWQATPVMRYGSATPTTQTNISTSPAHAHNFVISAGSEEHTIFVLQERTIYSERHQYNIVNYQGDYYRYWIDGYFLRDSASSASFSFSGVYSIILEARRLQAIWGSDFGTATVTIEGDGNTITRQVTSRHANLSDGASWSNVIFSYTGLDPAVTYTLTFTNDSDETWSFFELVRINPHVYDNRLPGWRTNANLLNILINGEQIHAVQENPPNDTYFNSAVLTYTIELAQGATAYPTILPLPVVGGAAYNIVFNPATPDATGGTATITVTAHDGQTQVYTINFIRTPGNNLTEDYFLTRPGGNVHSRINYSAVGLGNTGGFEALALTTAGDYAYFTFTNADSVILSSMLYGLRYGPGIARVSLDDGDGTVTVHYVTSISAIMGNPDGPQGIMYGHTDYDGKVVFGADNLDPTKTYTLTFENVAGGWSVFQWVFINPNDTRRPGWRDDATLHNIFINGRVIYETATPRPPIPVYPLRGRLFDSGVKNYTIILPPTVTAYPVITAFASVGGADIDIVFDPPTLGPNGGIATITVTSISGLTEEYTINFTRPAANTDFEWTVFPLELVNNPNATNDGWDIHPNDWLQVNGWDQHPAPPNHTFTYWFTGAESIRINGLYRAYSGFFDISIFERNPDGSRGNAVVTNVRRSLNIPAYYEHRHYGTLYAHTGLDPNQEYILVLTAPWGPIGFGSPFSLDIQGWARITSFVFNALPQGFDEDATLDAVFIGDRPLAGFDNTVMEHRISLDTSVYRVAPFVFPMSTYGNATIMVDRPLPNSMFMGEYTVTVTVVSANGQNTNVYTFVFYGDPFVRSGDNTLEFIMVNGVFLEGFDPYVMDYYIYYSPRRNLNRLPFLEFRTTDPLATYVVTQTSSIPGHAQIIVTADDGVTTRTYTINYSIGAPDGLTYTQTWLGNTFNGREVHVQNSIESMVVTPEGHIRTWSAWDEGGRRFGIYDRYGNILGNTDFSATLNEPYYYARRTEINGVTWMLGYGQPLVYDLTIPNYAERHRGSRIIDYTIYRVDSSGIRHDMNTLLGLVRPTAICQSNEGFLMIADDGVSQIIFFDVTDPTNPQEMFRFGSVGGISAGTPGLIHEDGYNKLFNQLQGLGMDGFGSLYIAGIGGGELILRRFDLGAIDPATGMFRSNALDFMAYDGTLAGEEMWLLSGLFCSLFDFDRESVCPEHGVPLYIFGRSSIWAFDPYATEPGREYRMKYFTLDHNRFPDDPRTFTATEYASMKVRWLDTGGGNYELFLYTMNSNPQWVTYYRFENGVNGTSRILQPVGAFGLRQGGILGRAAMANLPADTDPSLLSTAVVWRDINNNGSIDSDEFVLFPNHNMIRLSGNFMFDVDARGHIWFITDSRCAVELPIMRFDNNGIPVYAEPGGVTNYRSTSMANYFQRFSSLLYVYETDTMYVVGWPHNLPHEHMWQSIGRHLFRFDNWSVTGTQDIAFDIQLPFYDFDIEVNFGLQQYLMGPKSIMVVGDLLLVAYLSFGPMGSRQGEMTVYNAHTGEKIGDIIADPAIFGNVGWTDTQMAMNMIQLDDYTYMLLAYENYKGKNILYFVSLTPEEAPEDPGETPIHVAYARLITTAVDFTTGELVEPFWELIYELEQSFGGNENIAAFGANWDDNFLYIGVSVLDDNPVPPPASQFWVGDSIDIYISATNTTTPAYSSTDAQIVIPYGWPSNTFNIYPEPWERTPRLGAGMQSEWAYLYDGSQRIGYTIKVAIPWDNYLLVPYAGLVIGFDVMNNNSDGGIVVWAGNAGNWGNASNFGNLMMVGDDFMLHQVTFIENDRVFAIRDIAYPYITTLSAAIGGMPRNPMSFGRTFYGWWTGPNATGVQITADTVITGDTTVYAAWSEPIDVPATHIVTFMNNGDVHTTMTVTEPATTISILPTIPEREGFTFDGWWTGQNGTGTQFTTATPVTADTTVHAHWIADEPGVTTHTVTFMNNGTVHATVTVTSPATTVGVLPTAPKREGYTFSGWWTGQNGTGTQFTAATPVTVNVAVHASWIADEPGVTTHTVTFMNNGIVHATVTITSPTTTVSTLPTAPTRQGYAFSGWWTGQNGTGTQFTTATPVTANMTVHAHWTRNQVEEPTPPTHPTLPATSTSPRPATPRPPAQPAPAPDDLVPTYETTRLIGDALEYAAEEDATPVVEINLQSRDGDYNYLGAEFNAGDLLSLMENEGKIILYAGRFSAHVTYKQLAKLGIDEASIITLMLTLEDANIDEVLLNHVLGFDEFNATLINYVGLYYFSALIDGEFFDTNPTTIAVDLTNLGLTPKQLLRLTAFIFDEETQTYILIPGTLSDDGSSFIFDFDGNGVLGLMIHDWPTPILRFFINQYLHYHYQPYAIQRSSDVAPFIDPEFDRAMVPLRIISEALGAVPYWDAPNSTAYIILGDMYLRVALGVELPNGLGTPVLVNDRILVPTRYIAEHFNAVPVWNAEESEVIIFLR